MSSVKPVLQALVLAERVYEDLTTRKKIIAGTFNTVQIGTASAHEVGPATGDGKKTVRIPGGINAGSPWVYINLTEIHGRIPFTLQYVDLKHHSVLMKTEFAVECKNPLANVEVMIPLPELPTPHPGTYAIELMSDEYPIGALRIEVVSLDTGGPKNEHD